MFKYAKIEFVKNEGIKKEDGKMNIKVVHPKHGTGYISLDTFKVFKMTQKKNYYMSESVNVYPQKPFFVLDDLMTLDEIKAKTSKIFPGGNLSLSHVNKSTYCIVDNYFISSPQQKAKLYVELNILFPVINEKQTKSAYVYLPNQHARNKPPRKITGQAGTRQFITAGVECSKSPVLEDVDREFDILNYAGCHLKLDKDIDIMKLSRKELFQLLPKTNDMDKTFYDRMAKYARSLGLTVVSFNNLINEKKYYFTKEDYEKVEPEHIHKKTIINILSRWYPTIWSDRKVRQFQDLFDVKPNVIIDRFDKSHIHKSNKYLVSTLPMGSGKTTQTVNYLKENEDKNILWLTPRRSLVNSTITKLRQEMKSEFSNYLEMMTAELKTERYKKSKMLINCESIHYTQKQKYEIVVIDEIETLFNTFYTTSTHKTNINKNWQTLKQHIKNAGKVIILDAFITSKVIDFIKGVDPTEQITIIGTNKKPQERKIYTFKKNKSVDSNLRQWIGKIIEKVKEDKKVFIFYPYGTKSSTNYKNILEIQGMLQRAMPSKNILTYYGDQGAEREKELLDVNTYWKEADIVLCNSKITVGVNFDICDWFDSVFLSVAGFSDARDVVQASYRLRNIKSNDIYLLWLSSWKPKYNYDGTIDYIKCPIFRNLQEQLFIEKTAPVQDAFKQFCSLCNYTFTDISPQVDKYLEKILDDIFTLKLNIANYENIRDTADGDGENMVECIKRIENRIFTSSSSLEDKLIYRKYHFKSLFIDGTPEDIIKDLWNSSTQNLIQPYTEYMNKKTPVNDLLDILDCDKIEEAIEKELSPEAVDLIGKYIREKSILKYSSLAVLQSFLNGFFFYEIIKTRRMKSRNVKRILNPKIQQVFDNLEKFLRIRREQIKLNSINFIDD